MAHVARALDDIVDVDEIFNFDSLPLPSIARVEKRTTTSCLDSTANDTVINSLFFYGGAGTIVSLCPGAIISLQGAIFFTAPHQELSTQGKSFITGFFGVERERKN